LEPGIKRQTYTASPAHKTRRARPRIRIGILPKRNLNNGQPSLHAALIAAAAPQPGEHVLHIGVGVGYYTAILAELVGATGRVTAIEYDAELAARATANLAQTPHVRVVHGDGRGCSSTA
jgi:protein-L-isoaspartate(D-aspartate) O-methyltransferase